MFSIIQLNISTSTNWIGTTFSTDSHGSQKIYYHDLGDPRSFNTIFRLTFFKMKLLKFF